MLSGYELQSASAAVLAATATKLIVRLKLVMGFVQAVQVSAKLGGTQGKKAAKTVKKTVKQNLGKAKSTVKQNKNKAVTKSGASNWYGPDRPKFLGTIEQRFI